MTRKAKQRTLTVPVKRRRYRRFAVEDASVEYRLSGLAGLVAPLSGVSTLINMGLGGLQLVTSNALPLGSKLTLKVHFADGTNPFTTKGEVLWQQEVIGQPCYRTGVRFISVDGKLRRTLKAIEEKWWNIPEDRKRQIEEKIATRYPIKRPVRSTGRLRLDHRKQVVEEVMERLRYDSERSEGNDSQAEQALPIISVYEINDGKGLELGEGRELRGKKLYQLSLPFLESQLFACVLWDDSMKNELMPAPFSKGDIVVFSDQQPQSGDFALLLCQGNVFFRQVFFEEGGLIRLRPLNPWFKENLFASGTIEGCWKLVARLQCFTASE